MHGSTLEWAANGTPTGRHFLCPENQRGSKPPRGRKAHHPHNRSHRRHLARRKFCQSRRGQRIYRRRGQTIEPLNEWFKSLFELDHRVWHRGL